MNIKEAFLQWFMFFFDKKASAAFANKFAGGATKSEIMPNHQLAEELQI